MGIWSAIGSILGGPFGEALGSGYDSYSSEKSNYKNQKEFAQNSISWRVADAKRAGIHPLAALGNMGVSYQPFAVGGGEGQDISRALMANMDANERRRMAEQEAARLALRDKMDAETHNLAMVRGNLENELLRSQIARANSAQLGPGGARNTPPGVVDSVPSRVVVGSVGEPSRQPGTLTDYQYTHTRDGGLVLSMSEQAKDRNEDDLIAQAGWHWRNNIVPQLNSRDWGYREDNPPLAQYPLPRNQVWRWDWDRQAWYPYDIVARRWIRRD